MTCHTMPLPLTWPWCDLTWRVASLYPCPHTSPASSHPHTTITLPPPYSPCSHREVNNYPAPRVPPWKNNDQWKQWMVTSCKVVGTMHFTRVDDLGPGKMDCRGLQRTNYKTNSATSLLIGRWVSQRPSWPLSPFAPISTMAQSPTHTTPLLKTHCLGTKYSLLCDQWSPITILYTYIKTWPSTTINLKILCVYHFVTEVCYIKSE